MKKDLNKTLLFLTIIPIILFVSLSLYYENRLNQISLEYNEKSKTLKETTGKIVQEQLNKTIEAKETALKAKETLEEGYYNLKIDNEELKKDVDKLQEELNSVKGNLEDQKSKFNKLQEQYTQVQTSLIKANEGISRLIARVNELCSKLKASGGSDEKC